MIDIVYLAYNRIEFTRETIKAMITNTDWTQVGRLVVYDDGSVDGSQKFLQAVEFPVTTEFIFRKLGGPVAITNDYLGRKPAEVFAKIDNDVLLPPFWLSECLKVLGAHPELDLLGIEAHFPVQHGQVARGYTLAKHIGGIGLMRRRCFRTLPRASGRSGFTEWQTENKEVVKGWITPSIPVVLLDRVHRDPWVSYSRRYRDNGWQRNRALYTNAQNDLMKWWQP